MERTSSRFEFNARSTPETRHCDSPGCAGEGLYRAPKSSRQLREYHWFCLDHVRQYNKSWNFCSGFSEAEIEAMIRYDTTWERPTRRMTAWAMHEARLRGAAAAFADGGQTGAGADWTSQPPPRPAETPESIALALFGLTPPVDYAAIRARYIELVKRHHPDANGGDKAAEERLKTINQALRTLKAAYLD
jgi:DnaJ-domain-containing protein 1